jgi:hypothetical protein
LVPGLGVEVPLVPREGDCDRGRDGPGDGGGEKLNEIKSEPWVKSFVALIVRDPKLAARAVVCLVVVPLENLCFDQSDPFTL